MKLQSVIWAGIAIGLAAVPASAQRQLGVLVAGKVACGPCRAGRPVPLEVTITNQLRAEIRFGNFAERLSKDTIGPNTWNGETATVSLLDVYRDADSRSVFIERPELNVPIRVAGMGSHPISPGATLTLQTDASKWRIRGGWTKGRYRASVRIDNLVIDSHVTASVLSDPFEFVIE